MQLFHVKQGEISMSMYVVSDIHGNYEAFRRILEKIQFNHNDDTLVINGDIIDRGKDSYKMIQFVRATPNVIMLLGNHELMMVEYFKYGYIDWFANGGYTTFDELTQNNVNISELVLWIEKLPLTFVPEVNSKKFFIGHANPFRENKVDIVWDRLYPDKKIIGRDEDINSIAVVGHTPTAVFDPYSSKSKIIHNKDESVLFIDCGAGYPTDKRSRLACIRLDDLKEFYVDIT